MLNWPGHHSWVCCNICGINLLQTWRRKKFKWLDQVSKHNWKQWNGDDDSWARPSSCSKWKKTEIIFTRLNVCIQETIWHELFRLVPVFWVVCNPPCIHQDLLSAGRSYPASLVSWRFMWGIKSGIAIWSLIIYLTKAVRYGNLLLHVSDSVIKFSFPRMVSNSA